MSFDFSDLIQPNANRINKRYRFSLMFIIFSIEVKSIDKAINGSIKAEFSTTKPAADKPKEIL